MEKITVSEFKNKIYEEYKKQIDFISEVSEKELADGKWKADIGVATDMFIKYVDDNKKSVFVDIARAKARIAELKALIK